MRSTIHSSMGALFYCAIFVWQPTNKKGYCIKQLKVLNVRGNENWKNNFCLNRSIKLIFQSQQNWNDEPYFFNLFYKTCVCSIKPLVLWSVGTISPISGEIVGIWVVAGTFSVSVRSFKEYQFLEKKNWGECWLGCNT